MSWMTIRDAGVFLCGASAAFALVAAVYFLKFRRRTGDRFFTMFAVAFFLMALNRVGIVVAGPVGDHVLWFYLVRLAAYLVILLAIVQKNLPRRGRSPK